MKNIEFEYVNVDENILAPGRVSIHILIIIKQHVAEFKHIFEHFTVPSTTDKAKKGEDKKESKEEAKDVFAKNEEDEDYEEKKKETKLSKKQRKLN